MWNDHGIPLSLDFWKVIHMDDFFAAIPIVC
jgi:hypothetical protein